jgi:hypothetical protein
MYQSRPPVIPKHWSVKIDAVDGWMLFDMETSSSLSNLNASYLSGPLAGQAAFNPPLPGPFIPSMAMPAAGYAGLAEARRPLYQSEKATYDRDIKIVTDLRTSHAIKTGSAISNLISMFSPECVACKAIFAIKKAGMAANLDAGGNLL